MYKYADCGTKYCKDHQALKYHQSVILAKAIFFSSIARWSTPNSGLSTNRSRADHTATTQLIELEFWNRRLHDLEDVLEHVFQQGFLDAQLRPVSWWERSTVAKSRAVCA